MENEFIKTELQKFNIADAVIAQLSAEFMPLKIKSLDDKEGAKKVRSARMVIKGKRVEVEKKRKELKASSLAFGQAVDGEAKRITALLELIETHLEEEESIFEKEQERLRLEVEEKLQHRLQGRIQKLKAYNYTMYLMDTINSMSDNDFELVVAQAKLEYKAEQVRLLEEEKRSQIEVEMLARVRAEQETESKRLIEIARHQRDAGEKIRLAQEKIENEKRAIEDEKRAKEIEKIRQEELEKTRKDAAEKAKIELELEIKREAEGKIEAERLAKVDAERRESLKPDKEKLITLAGKINTFELLELPTVSSSEANTVMDKVKSSLGKIANYIMSEAGKL